MPNLIELDTTWMNADILEPLAYLQKLERLSISRLQGSMSDDNEYFVPSFKGSSKIKELNMAYSSQMTDSAFVSITRTCRQIEVLNVEGDCRLTHEGLIAWCDQLAAEAAAAAAEGENDHNHDDDVTAVTGQRRSMGAGALRFETGVGQVGMTHLTTICFANCNRIQTDGFQTLFERSRHLQNVDLMATRIGDEALHTLSTRNAGLHTLNLNCCPNISDQGLQSVLRTSRQLRVVSFLYCNRITVRVFFQNVWKCLDLQVLRFSLNARHADLISHGVTAVQGTNSQDTTTTATATAATTTEQDVSNYFYEPQFEYMVFGKPDPEDDPQQHINSGILDISLSETPQSRHQDENAGSPLGTAAPSQWASVQEYRQYQIVSQVYRQIERLKQLQTLDIRNIHLPLDIASGFHRLGHLKELQVLMLTGLERPLGELEIAWLTNTIHQEGMQLPDDDTDVEPLSKEVPLPQLRELVFKNCQGLSMDLLKQLKNYRPLIDVQMT
ncbi:hypothetical protein BGX34_002524 [Mortierella sp. NVP85]|nr:hypothetical protein BGX34_002524 [Mortierella sp. NVP85]